MPSGPTESSSNPENLCTAICLLALIIERPQGFDELFSKDERINQNEESLSRGSTLENTKSLTTAADDNFEDPDEADDDVDKQLNLGELRDKVLDRLAETLARFKSSPRGNQTKAKFLYAKNEGLEQEGTVDDTAFLDSWRELMECIFKTGPAVEEAKASLFHSITDFQRPRINHYLRTLQDVFAAEKSTKLAPHSDQANVKLSETWIQNQPGVRSSTWVDDNGNQFTIPIISSTGDNVESEGAVSGDSLGNINDEVNAIFDKIDRLSFKHCKRCDSSIYGTTEMLLKELMAASLGLLKSVRHRSAIKSRLRSQF